MSTQTIEQQLTAANADVAHLNAEVTRLNADLSAANQLAEEAQANANTASGRNAALEAELATANEERRTLAARVATLEGDAQTASARAAEIATRQCHIPAATASDDPTSGGSIASQFLAIKDPSERSAFFKKHEKEILSDTSLKP